MMNGWHSIKVKVHSASWEVYNYVNGGCVYFISEVSSNHQQSLERCLEFVDVSHNIGCEAVKFQLFKVEELFSPEAIEKRPEFLDRKLWELPVDFIKPISERCNELGIDFGCTPFYLDAVDELLPFVDFFKIASYELLWLDLLKKVASTNKPVVISSGMATLGEIDKALECLIDFGADDITLLHCVSGYPTPLSDCNLRVLETYKTRYPAIKVGWSDHTVNPVVMSEAVLHKGAECVEFHLDLEGDGGEFDTGHCWLPKDIEKVIRGIKANELIEGDGIKSPAKSEIFDREWRADPSDGLRPLRSTRVKL